MTAGANPRTVADIMSREVLTVGRSATIAEAAVRMNQRRVGSIVVVENSHLVGILTERDLLRFAASGADASVATVAEWMTANPNTVGPDELSERRPLEDVWYLMFEGELPTKAQRRAFMDEVRPLRAIPEGLKPLLPAVARLGQDFVPLDALRTSISLLGSALGFKSWLDVEREELRH